MDRSTISTLRSDEEEMIPIQANANNIKKDSLDCGILAIGCCNSPKYQKMGTTKSYLTVLCLIGIIQGAIEKYFVLSVKQAAMEHSYDERAIDWLMAASGIFQGIFAIVIAYWGDRIHRISWTAALVIFQAIMAVTLIVPTLTYSSNSNTIAAINTDSLCLTSSAAKIVMEQPHGITTLVLLFVLQFGIALGNIAFFTLGISYLDDNLKEHESPSAIGIALAAKYWGPQFGSALSLGIEATPFGWWLGWTILSPLLFIIGVILALFPKRLLNTCIRQAANVIIEVATNNSSQASLAPEKFIADTTFWSSIKRLLTNKIVMFNALAAVFVQSAIVNFYFHEENYLQSRFFLPASNNEWTSRMVTNLLKPPMISISVLLAGLIIAKFKPSARKLAAWNVITGIIVIVFFIVYIFIDCQNGKIAGVYRSKLNKPFCAQNCLCSDNIPFSPVCPEESVHTYFSPCHAGCSVKESINSFIVYKNCTCGVDSELEILDGLATEGGCRNLECQMFWITFQGLTVFAAALLGTGLIGNLLLSLRSVLPQDKSLALSIELWLVGLIVYIPSKIGFTAIANYSCQLWSPSYHKCFLHENPLFGNLINIVTASLIFVGVLFDAIVIFLVKDMQLYGNNADDRDRSIPMNTLNRGYNSNNNTNNNNNNSNNNNTNNVEDDYETYPMISSIQSTQPNYPRSISPETTQLNLTDSTNTPTNLNAIVYSEIRRKNPDEDIPLNFNLQTTDSEPDTSLPPDSSDPMYFDLRNTTNGQNNKQEIKNKLENIIKNRPSPETDL